jgi:hypothetical protein
LGLDIYSSQKVGLSHKASIQILKPRLPPLFMRKALIYKDFRRFVWPDDAHFLSQSKANGVATLPGLSYGAVLRLDLDNHPAISAGDLNTASPKKI